MKDEIPKFNYPTYFVGGYVRDEILGVASKDIDIVMMAPSYDTMLNEIERVGGQIFLPVGRSGESYEKQKGFLVARANIPGIGPVDAALPRIDGSYSDGRRPDDTSIASSLEADMARRDFSCNAIAKNVETGELIDPFGGIQDILIHRIIRAVGNPKKRLEEDKIRAFRAVRFIVTKRFSLDENLKEVIKSLHPNEFSGVSAERVVVELEKMFKADTFLSFFWLDKFPNLMQVVEDKKIWFQPTLRAK